ncbi:MAG: molybdopterin cofactor-binding domain-containing protein [Hyphomicrobiales bacterium]
MTGDTTRLRLSRRAFLASAGAATVAIAAGGGYALLQPEIVQSGRIINAFLALLPDGRIEFVCPAMDLGQGAPLALSMILAEEIGADLAQVVIVDAPRDAARYGNPDFMGRMVTADSRTTRGYYQPLRLAGAEAAAALRATACRARGWRPGDCELAGHAVRHRPSAEAMPFADIARLGRLEMPGSGDIALKPEAAMALLGASPADPGALARVTGRRRFGVDRRAADMSIAVLARNPHLGGTVVRLDEAAALAVPGVEAVVTIEAGGAVAVVGRETWAVLRGRAALDIEWSPAGDFDTAGGEAALVAALADPAANPVPLRRRGDEPDAGDIVAEFHAPALKHVIMEPLNASARGKSLGLGVIIAGSTQSPDLDMRFAARTWKTAPFMVDVEGHPSGGAYGRRVLNDAVADAAAIARALGRPVQVVRPMLDELRRGQIRPAAFQRIAASLDENGALASWRHDIASDGTLATELPSSLKGADGREDNTATDGAYHPYRAARERIAWTYLPAAPKPGFLRGVSAGYTVWAIEVMVDRLARRAGIDPLDWRLRNLADDRLAAATRRVAEMAGWGEPDRTLGLAVMSFRGSSVATIAEVRAGRLAGLWIAADVGRIVHRDNVLAQIEGGAVWGVSMALTESLAFADGRALVDGLADYPVIGLGDIPPIAIDLLPPQPGDAPCGVGEIGVPTTVAAIANAFEAATGKAFDRLPLAL